MTLRSSLSLWQLFALVATFSHLLVAVVDAHGFITWPASRSYMCKQGQAKNCGEIQYEPQSVEAPKGLPFARSGNGHLCSAGLSQFAELDRQGAGVWPTTKASNVRSFSWTFTAQHATTDFKYFITKSSWDSATTRGLSASDFESKPFLTVPMYGKPPAASMTHDLSKSLPSRSGYHVVYAVWTVDNTANAFYQCMDLDFGGAGANDGVQISSGNASSTAAASSSPSATSTAASSANTGASSTASGSTSPSSGSTSGGTSSNETTPSAAGSVAKPKSHAATANGGCRMKRKRAPAGSVLAARGDYRRRQMQAGHGRRG